MVYNNVTSTEATITFSFTELYLIQLAVERHYDSVSRHTSSPTQEEDKLEELSESLLSTIKRMTN